MKLIKVKRCGDPDCPYFKRINHYDYNDECICEKVGEYVPQVKYEELDRGFTTLRSLAGEFPEWCPLKNDPNDIKDWG